MPITIPTKKRTVKKTAVKKKLTPIVYQHHPRTPTADPSLQLPVNFDECDGTYAVLDLITLAAEAGQLSAENWVRECFGTIESFEAFLENFGSYDDCYRVSDRWWDALANLAGSQYSEEGFIRTDDMASCLRDAADETGQL